MSTPAFDLDLSGLNWSDQAHLLAEWAAIPNVNDEDILAEVSREDPRDFILEVLGEEPSEVARKYGYETPYTPQQELVLESVFTHKDTAVPSCNGAGKSWLVARIILWWLFRRRRSVVVFTAPTARQVETILWNELRDAIARSKTKLPCRLLNSPYPQIVVGTKWYAIGISTKPTGLDLSATSFQGFHSDYVMVVYEEATGIDPRIKDAGDSVTLRPTDRRVAIGNPTDPVSWFKEDACDAWSCVHFDGFEHPNYIHDNPDIVPGAITREWCEERLEEYGSDKAPLYLARVRGLFPEQSTDALIQRYWLTRAQRVLGEAEKVNEDEDGYGVTLGVDVSGEGEDLFTIWALKSSRLFIPQLTGGKYAWHSGRDVMKGVGLVRAVLAEVPDVRTIAIDDTAIGNGVTSRLHELNSAGKLPMFRAGDILHPAARKIRIIGINFGESAWRAKLFRYKKDELWWMLREEFRKDKILLPSTGEIAAYALPRHSDPIKQLATAIYDRPGGKIEVYDKRSAGGAGAREKTKSLPEKSPDNAHSIMLASYAKSQTTQLERAPRLITTQQIFDAQSRELIERAIAKRVRGGRAHTKPSASAAAPKRSTKGVKPSWMRRSGRHRRIQ